MIDEARALRESIADRYAIERELGRGGMATVYLARDLRHPRRVAIKVLRPELSLGVTADRFESEIAIAAALAHPNIVPVFDSGGEGDHLFYVMPYIEGESLRALLDREHHLPLDRALAIVRDVGDALVYAHTRNIIHRDIKPENILLVEGRAVLSDFGIARAVAAAGPHRLTQAGMAVGTPLYMSPEQAVGETAIDQRSDLYSLALVLYEMLSGSSPHTADTPQRLLVQKLVDPVPSVRAMVPDVPTWVDDALARALVADPAQRPPTVAGWLESLRGPRASTTLRRARAERRWLAVAAVAVAVAATVIAIPRLRGREGAGRASARHGVAVFPFHATAAEGASLQEAIPDLLATALDGTPGISVIDPWSTWRPLRADGRASARSPDVAEATSLAQSLGAESFIVGSITQIGREVDVTARIYRRGDADPVRTLSASGPADSVFRIVRALAVEAIQTLAAGTPTAGPLQVEHSLTRSPDALKAWLRARELTRRGAFDSAEVAIDRALSLDSSFVLALVDAASIKSWAQFTRGDEYAGLRELAERAVRLADSSGAPERVRWRARAMLASITTDGPSAVAALNQLLAADSTDYEAWRLLTYAHTVYGWQYGASWRDAVNAAERSVRLDSTDAGALAQRLFLALALDDSADVARQVARARHADTTAGVLAGMLQSVDALAADDGGFAERLPRFAALAPAPWITVYRLVRNERPDRADRLITATRTLGGPMAPIAMRAAAQMAGAEGRWRALDSLRRAGAFASAPGFDHSVDREIVAGAVAGAGDLALARTSAAALGRGHPPDSALAQFPRAPVWHDGWLIGAHEAMYGDTALARRWQAALLTLPTKGASPRAYTTALAADIAARVAARRGDVAGALAEARRAMTAWDVHSNNVFEFMPEPAIRFHLALLLRAAGRTDSAMALCRSLTMPTTWMAFYTARASLELGEMQERTGDRTGARHSYVSALRLWEAGDASVNGLRERARQGIGRLDQGR